jgi:hypothetical protein
MATFTELAKKMFTKFFCNTEVAGLGEIFLSSENFTYYGISIVISCAFNLASACHIVALMTNGSFLPCNII